MARIRALAAMRVPRCAGLSTSRALLYPMCDWSTLSLACSKLSFVNPRKSLSPIVEISSSLLLQDCVAVHSEDVV